MEARNYELLVVGAGIFGLTAALELRRRGYRVGLLDQGQPPYDLAASTDISKVMRLEYAADEDYFDLARQAHTGWLSWNDAFGTQLYHETGLVMLTRGAMAPGGYEYESYQLLHRHGYMPERLDSAAIARRYPAWNSEIYTDGYFNPVGGYVESSRTVSALLEQATREGVVLHTMQQVTSLRGSSSVVVTTRSGAQFTAEHIIVAAGAWTPVLLPELRSVLRPVGLPVFHLLPADATLFAAPQFLVFNADITRTGWYGFPVHPREGVLKLAYHGRGRPLNPERDERVVDEPSFKRKDHFLAEALPSLLGAQVVATRLCLYCDTPDGHFWIDRHPERPSLTVVGGDSGHGFKFAPVLGQLIADAVERRPNRYTSKFGWRTLAEVSEFAEASRASAHFDEEGTVP